MDWDQYFNFKFSFPVLRDHYSQTFFNFANFSIKVSKNEVNLEEERKSLQNKIIEFEAPTIYRKLNDMEKLSEREKQFLENYESGFRGLEAAAKGLDTEDLKRIEESPNLSDSVHFLPNNEELHAEMCLVSYLYDKLGDPFLTRYPFIATSSLPCCHCNLILSKLGIQGSGHHGHLVPGHLISLEIK